MRWMNWIWFKLITTRQAPKMYTLDEKKPAAAKQLVFVCHHAIIFWWRIVPPPYYRFGFDFVAERKDELTGMSEVLCDRAWALSCTVPAKTHFWRGKRKISGLCVSAPVRPSLSCDPFGSHRHAGLNLSARPPFPYYHSWYFDFSDLFWHRLRGVALALDRFPLWILDCSFALCYLGMSILLACCLKAGNQLKYYQ